MRWSVISSLILLFESHALAQSPADAGSAAPEQPVVEATTPPAPAAEAPTAAPEAPTAAPEAPATARTTFQRPSLTVGMFGNLTGSYSNAAPLTFGLGQLDLFVTSRPHPSLNLLAEVVFEAGTDQSFIVDVERVMATWLFDPRLRVTVGRVHQAFGYYNAAYHHGAVLMNTIERPAVVAFEDEGGVLPVHAIGIELGGDWALGDFSLGYSVTVSNGRGRNPDEILNVQDLNFGKSVLGSLTLKHTGLGLRVGLNALYDQIPDETDENGATLRPRQEEVILGAHLLLNHDLVWFLAEGYLINHQSAALGLRRTLGFFAEGRVNFRPLWAYARFDLIGHSEEIDPFFDPAAPAESKRSALLGIGWKVASGLVLKVEGELGFPAGGSLRSAARAQLAWSL